MRAIGLIIIFALLFGACARRPAYTEAPVSGDAVVINMKGLKESAPAFYSYKHGNKRIDFFVVNIKGELQSYFDACAKCYPDRLGYRAGGEYVSCKKCDVKYSLDSLKTGIGSCYPIILKGKTEGDKYIIDRKAVIEGEKFF